MYSFFQKKKKKKGGDTFTITFYKNLIISEIKLCKLYDIETSKTKNGKSETTSISFSS